MADWGPFSFYCFVSLKLTKPGCLDVFLERRQELYTWGAKPPRPIPSELVDWGSFGVLVFAPGGFGD